MPLESGKTMLDCNSAEWCILNYLYDLCMNCSTLKTSERFSELKRHFPMVSLKLIKKKLKIFSLEILINTFFNICFFIKNYLVRKIQSLK